MEKKNKIQNHSGYVKRGKCQNQNEATHSGRKKDEEEEGRKTQKNNKSVILVIQCLCKCVCVCVCTGTHMLSSFNRSPPLSPSPYIAHSTVNFTSQVVHFY